MHWTAPGRVLIAWDSGLGPSFAYDAETLAETSARLYDWYEVWRSTAPDSDGVDLGSTTAEAWLDVWVRPSTVYWYTIYGHMDSGGDGVQVGPRIRVETRGARSRSADGDVVPPSGVDTLLVRRGAGGNVLKLRPSADAESGVLAYLVYTDNGAQPAYVVWVDTWDTEADAERDVWRDRAGTAQDGYVVRALDAELNLSAAHDPVVPVGGLYVLDSNNALVRTLSEDGETSRYAGRQGVQTNVDGADGVGSLCFAYCMTADEDGVLWFTDLHHAVRKVATDGAISTVAGSPSGTSVAGHIDGQGASAAFNYPRGICKAGDGNFYVVDEYNDVVRKVTPQGAVTTFVGQHRTRAIASSAAGTPGVVTMVEDHHFNSGEYVVIGGHSGAAPPLSGSYRVVVTGAKTFTLEQFYEPHAQIDITTGGSGGTCYRESRGNRVDGDGLAARLSDPFGICWDGVAECLYVCEIGDGGESSAIRKVTLAGVVTTVYDGNILSAAQTVTTDADGLIYVGDTSGYCIQVIDPTDPTPTPTVYAGTEHTWGWADGDALTEAKFDFVAGLRFDAAGVLWVCDSGNNCIRKVAGGVVSTVAGLHGESGYAEGSGEAALFANPWDIAVAP